MSKLETQQVISYKPLNHSKWNILLSQPCFKGNMLEHLLASSGTCNDCPTSIFILDGESRCQTPFVFGGNFS